MDARARRGSRATSIPATRTLPASARRSPATTETSVVLPAPLRPRSPTMLPGSTARSTPSSATVAPYDLRTPSDVEGRAAAAPVGGRSAIRPSQGYARAVRFQPVCWIPMSIPQSERVWQGSDMTFEPLTPERRRELTRRHLLEAAAIVFARDGFHGAPLDDVAALAGFTKGAVYSNFKSKDDLFLALLDDRVDQQFAVTAEVSELGPHDRESQFPQMRSLDLGRSSPRTPSPRSTSSSCSTPRRNPVAREKLIASSRRERDLIEALITREQGNVDAAAPYSTTALAEFSRAVLNGLSLTRLVDPEAVTETTLDTTLAMLYDAMGADPDDHGSLGESHDRIAADRLALLQRVERGRQVGERNVLADDGAQHARREQLQAARRAASRRRGARGS